MNNSKNKILPNGTKLIAIKDFADINIDDIGTIIDFDGEDYHVDFDKNNWYLTQDLQLEGDENGIVCKIYKENLNMNNEIKIDIPEGYEVDKEKSTFTCIKLKKIEVKSVDTWEELDNISGWYVVENSDLANIEDISTDEANRNVFHTQKQAISSIYAAMYSQLKLKNNSYEILCEYIDKMKPLLELVFGDNTDAYIALTKLEYLKKEVNKDWIPNLKDTTKKHIIRFDQCGFYCTFSTSLQSLLSFPTEQIRDEFLRDHEDLILQAKPLL